MAEALLRYEFGDRYEALSAGIEATEVDPLALKVLDEINVDTSGLRSRSTDEFKDVDLVVTVCDRAKETCPFFPGAREYIHQGFRDPPDLVNEGTEPMEAFRMIRDEIRVWIKERFGVE